MLSCSGLFVRLFCRCLELEEETRFELEYTQQLLLSCLLSIISHLTTTHTDITGKTQSRGCAWDILRCFTLLISIPFELSCFSMGRGSGCREMQSPQVLQQRASWWQELQVAVKTMKIALLPSATPHEKLPHPTEKSRKFKGK